MLLGATIQRLSRIPNMKYFNLLSSINLSQPKVYKLEKRIRKVSHYFCRMTIMACV